jgi:phage host-nuclease inhibitor protein Gam
VADEQFTVNEEVREGQVQYYLDAQNAVDPNAHIANVKDLEEFKAALADASKSLINLTADFTTTEKILVSRDDVTINGNNKTITFTGDETGWQGNYVLHVYNTTGVTIKDIKLTGGDAALLVNGSEVTLTGAIDVSGNEFGGIESSKGVGVEKDPKLTVTGATFTNTSEAYGLPTIWEDQVEGTVVVADEQFTVNEEVREGQVQYYLDAQNAVDPNAHIANVKDLEEFKAALADASKSLINLTADFTTTEKILVSRDDVTINGNNKTITFTGDETGWQGNYVLHVYNTTGVTIKDIKLTGGDAALLVNGSEVTLTGAIDVSGNEFGGIESSKGVGVEKDPKLTVTGATFTNTSEAYGLPTIWEDQVEGTVVVADEQFTVNEEVREGQVQYYLDAQNAVDPNAHIANVKDLEEFKAALADASKSLINLTADFTTTEKILVSRDDVTINGNNKTITFTGDETGWQGNYVLHVYNTTGVTIKDIKLTGGDAALLVNGSEVTLTGAIDVSGNEFGGIESSKGVGVEKDPKLTVTGATFTNTSEAYGLPTIWEDQVEGTVVVADEQFTVNEEVREGQVQYYLDAQNAVDPNAHIANVKDLEEFKAALADASKSLINLTADFTTTEKILVSRDDVTINGNNKTITFTGDETGWQGNYVLHVYNTTGVTIKDIKLTGGDAALLVNGSEVTLTGAIDVSGNEFGGIESSKGVGVEKDPKLTVTGATFTNTSEAYGLPTIWEDQVEGTVVVADEQFTVNKR